jgi:hypothetical protein
MTVPAPRHLVAFLAVAGSLLIAPAAAQNFCVAPNTTCGGTNVTNFQDALDLAAADTITDHIYLGAATYVAPNASGFH